MTDGDVFGIKSLELRKIKLVTVSMGLECQGEPIFPKNTENGLAHAKLLIRHSLSLVNQITGHCSPGVCNSHASRHAAHAVPRKTQRLNMILS